MIKRKYYTFKLGTLAPVHIGSGDQLKTKEYIYENNEYYIPEIGKLYHALHEENPALISKLESFFQTNKEGNRLGDFLRNNNVKTRDFGGYKIKASGFEGAQREQKTETTDKQKARLNEISLCMKDPMGYPYIPGSSLKGAIRTILVNQYFKKDNHRKDFKSIPWGSQKNKPFNDIFHNIRVSDSERLSKDVLMLAEKTDYSVKKGDNTLPITRESIKPFKEIVFHITAEGEQAIGLIEQLEKLAEQHYEDYDNFFLEEWPEELVTHAIKAPLYLGGGAGLWTKTLLSEAPNIRKKFQNRGRFSMSGKNGLLKLTRAKNKMIKQKNGDKSFLNNEYYLYEMGKCMFRIYEDKEKNQVWQL